jgi:phosphoglycerate dehydrogenase-like enzyme
VAKPLRVVLGEWQTDGAFRRAITTPVEFVPAPTLRDEDVAPLLHGADVFLSKAFTPGMTAAADSLRLIHTPGAGTDWIDFAAVPGHVSVCNVFGHEVSIAEYVFMAVLALNRDLRNMDARFRAGDWSDRKSRPPGTEIRGQTLLVLGLGHIGAEVARVGKAFGMRVIGVTRNAGPERAIAAGVDECRSYDQLLDVLPEADFVVVAVPLDAGTTGLMSERELAAMKPSAFLINVARGEVVAEEPLFAALRDRRIGGAAIDVWYRYPEGAETVRPSAFPFHELDNMLMTPHIAGWTRETFQHRWAAIDENLRRLSAGEPLLNVVKAATR